jgi:hypothetical protein
MGLVLLEGETTAELLRRKDENAKKKGEPTQENSGPLY